MTVTFGIMDALLPYSCDIAQEPHAFMQLK